MREQWCKFLDEHAHCWSYNIVPELVKCLAVAVESGHGKRIIEILYALSTEGIGLDRVGNLCFL